MREEGLEVRNNHCLSVGNFFWTLVCGGMGCLHIGFCYYRIVNTMYIRKFSHEKSKEVEDCIFLGLNLLHHNIYILR